MPAISKLDFGRVQLPQFDTRPRYPHHVPAPWAEEEVKSAAAPTEEYVNRLKFTSWT